MGYSNDSIFQTLAAVTSFSSFPLYLYIYIYIYIKGCNQFHPTSPSLSRTLTRLGKQHGRGHKEGCFSFCANLPLQQFFSHNLYKKYTDKANRFGQQGTNTLPKPFRGSAAVTKTPLTSQFSTTELRMLALAWL